MRYVVDCFYNWFYIRWSLQLYIAITKLVRLEDFLRVTIWVVTQVKCDKGERLFDNMI